jgi:hypothetical protein
MALPFDNKGKIFGCSAHLNLCACYQRSRLRKGAFDFRKAGDPGWIRTIDLPLRRRPLYPLSYGATRILHASNQGILQLGIAGAALDIVTKWR